MDFQNIDFMRILKWILIVLITGFLAQFGKSFAKYIMAKIRTGKTSEEADQDTIDVQAKQKLTLTPDQDVSAEEKTGILTETYLTEKKTQEKLQKKALKAQVKQQKKEAK